MCWLILCKTGTTSFVYLIDDKKAYHAIRLCSPQLCKNFLASVEIERCHQIGHHFYQPTMRQCQNYTQQQSSHFRLWNLSIRRRGAVEMFRIFMLAQNHFSAPAFQTFGCRWSVEIRMQNACVLFCDKFELTAAALIPEFCRPVNFEQKRSQCARTCKSRHCSFVLPAKVAARCG